jgi:uncharacterized Zn-finger protein
VPPFDDVYISTRLLPAQASSIERFPTWNSSICPPPYRLKPPPPPSLRFLTTAPVAFHIFSSSSLISQGTLPPIHPSTPGLSSRHNVGQPITLHNSTAMDHRWAVTTSSGRRVSLLCDDRTPRQPPAPQKTTTTYPLYTSSPTPPPSPDYHIRPHLFRTDSLSSSSSATSSFSATSSLSSASSGIYSPCTPPPTSVHLPPLEKLLPVPESPYYYPPFTVSPEQSPLIFDGSLSPSSTYASTVSAPSSPKIAPSAAAATAAATSTAGVKRSGRRYTCHCSKSFTTSGHLARHTRIHTGEKNYLCPEAGCAARFSRQDNCMQHYRTHQGGVGGKRTAKKRRGTVSKTSMRSEASDQAPRPAEQHQKQYEHQQPVYAYNYASQVPPYAAATPVSADGGLAALASVACCKGYTQ